MFAALYVCVIAHGYTQACMQIMQHMHTHKAMTRHVGSLKCYSFVKGNGTVNAMKITGQLIKKKMISFLNQLGCFLQISIKKSWKSSAGQLNDSIPPKS